MKSILNNYFGTALDTVLWRFWSARPKVNGRRLCPCHDDGKIVICGKKGFTLLETLLAIGILSVVVAQVVSVQGTQISVSKIAADNIRATWALRHMISQLQYVVETLGVAGLPKNPVDIPWSGDVNFTIRLEVKELNVEPSRMILSAMKLAMGGLGGEDAANDESNKEAAQDSMAGFKEMASLIDSKLPKDLYRSYNVTVSWKEGDKSRSIEGGGMIIDNKVLVGLVGAGAAATGAQGAGGGATATAKPTPVGTQGSGGGSRP